MLVLLCLLFTYTQQLVNVLKADEIRQWAKTVSHARRKTAVSDFVTGKQRQHICSTLIFLQQASTELAKVERNNSGHQFLSFLTVTKKKSNQRDYYHNLQRS